MTSLLAKVLSIEKRGLIKEDYYADIVVFNEKTISNNATFKIHINIQMELVC